MQHERTIRIVAQRFDYQIERLACARRVREKCPVFELVSEIIAREVHIFGPEQQTTGAMVNLFQRHRWQIGLFHPR